MSDIKTKESVMKKDGVRVLDRTRLLSDKLKDGTERGVDYAKDVSDDGEVTPEEYAENRIKYATEDSLQSTGKGIKKTYERGRDTIKKHYEKKTAKETEDAVHKTAEKGFKSSVRNTERITKESMKNSERTVKGTGKTIKTAEQTAKTTVKTAEATAKATEKAAQATAKASKAAAEAARRAAIAAYKAAVAIGKAIVAACKAIAAGISKLVAAIAAGGWVAVLIIVIICAVAAIAISCFAIFLPSTDSLGSSYTIQSTMDEINRNYTESIEAIKSSNTYDEVKITGDVPNWKNVLSVFSVKMTLDPNNPQEVLTMDSSKAQELANVFWKMNSISSYTQKEERERTVQTVDSSGKSVSKKEKYTVVVLLIERSAMSVYDASSTYGFSSDQRKSLEEMLSSSYDSYWRALLN